jgi:hypothetical protein
VSTTKQEKPNAEQPSSHSESFRWRVAQLWIQAEALAALAPDDGEREQLLAAARVVDAVRHALEHGDGELLRELDLIAHRAMKGSDNVKKYPWLAGSEADRDASFLSSMKRHNAELLERDRAGTLATAEGRKWFVEWSAAYLQIARFPELASDVGRITELMNASFPPSAWPPAFVGCSDLELARHVLQGAGVAVERLIAFGQGSRAYHPRPTE